MIRAEVEGMRPDPHWARVIHAAQEVVRWGEHCSQGYRGPCEHCTAMEELEASVKELESPMAAP